VAAAAGYGLQNTSATPHHGCAAGVKRRRRRFGGRPHPGRLWGGWGRSRARKSPV